jgi:hypothetical protein
MTFVWIVLLIVVGLVGSLYLSRVLMSKALRDVVARFHKLGATQAENAASLEQLDLAPGRMFERMFKRRDYKPSALRLLIQSGIVITTEDGTLYLSEDALERSNLKATSRIK